MAWYDAIAKFVGIQPSYVPSPLSSGAIAVVPNAPAVEQPLLASTAYAAAGSTIAGALNWPRYNPDQLLTRQGLHIYDQMMIDEQVKAVMKFKRDAILSRAWTFKYEDDSKLSPDEQVRRIKVLTRMVQDKLKGSFEDALTYILRSMKHGFSVSEKIYDQVLIDGLTYYACVELRPKPPFSFYFITDQYGTLQRFGQNYGGALRDLDIRKFIHHVNEPSEDQWFGRSELRAAYRSYYSKDVLIKMQNLWMERLAGGFIVVEPETTAPVISPADRTALVSALGDIKTISGLLLPPGYKAKNVSATTGTEFKDTVAYHDLAIAKALLVPNLLGLSNNGGTGAYAQSQTQLEAFFWTINSDTHRLEAVVNEQWFYEVCELNFGDGEYPCFSFKPASEEFVKWVVGQWTSLIGSNAVVTTEADEKHLRQILNMPSRSKQDKPLVTPSQEQANKLTDAKTQQLTTKETVDVTGDESYTAHTHDGKPRACSVASFSRASARVAFSVIEHKAESYAAQGRTTLAGIVAAAVVRILHSVPQYVATPSTVQDATFTRSDMQRLNTACRTVLQNGWDLGQRQAVKELESARKVPMARRSFAALRDQAAEFLSANGFRMAGNLADGAKSIIQQELLNGVKAGDRPELIKARIFERLISRGMTNLQSSLDNIDETDVQQALNEALGASTDKQAAAYLDTLARTNVFEAMNEARFNEFTDPELDGFVQALEYSAILDDRTTEICSALDGDTYAADNPLWDTYRPPNHYNCRSVLIPVTKADGWDGEESDDPVVDPAVGFGAGEK